ncbi:potassium/proton antiporter [Devosia sp. PTR5]|uniref:Potassium/proton antiporter n=1 Tax=Devosia oryzisoli TaxID=2774138 RepID=A0A927ISK3_9HYPH|nr:potassium/proton antiporter [Devosia oryzisoli]MBD8064801.1 potassium/proton antiporter [Devosia oryzisoli]
MVDWIYLVILISSGLLVASIFTSLAAFRFGAPLLLVFLFVGLAAGEDGLGLQFSDAGSAYFIGSLALAVILFDSGFGTTMRSFRQAAGPAMTLATVGVLLTAALVGVAAHILLGLGVLQSLLLGAIVGSTDAAAVFFLLRIGQITVRERVRSTLEIESGSNDPMAIFLTVVLVESIAAGISSPDASVLIGFVQQMGLGVVFGLGGGLLIAITVNRINLEGALYPVMVLGGALFLFALTGLLGGSGFLAVYVAGLVAGNRRLRAANELRRFQGGMTWLAQIVMFVMLGLYAAPSEFLAAAPGALLLAFVLIFVARPIAVWLCLLPFGFRAREQVFLGWVGLRGAVSILLAILPVIAELPNGQLYFNTVFIVVLVSLVLQGWTIRPMARWLKLIVPPTIGPLNRVELELPGTAHHELVVYRVTDGSPVARGARLPRWARPSLIIRDGQSMKYQQVRQLKPGDNVYVFTAPRFVRLLDRLFAGPTAVAQDDRDFFGVFDVDPTQPVHTLAALYGLTLPDGIAKMTIANFIASKVGGSAEVGDRVALETVELVVREVDEEGRTSAAGLAIVEEPGTAAPRRIGAGLLDVYRRAKR